MHARWAGAWIVIAALAVAPPLVAHAQTGGYQGFGAGTPGGAGGATVHVTTLADSGPGSLRDAVSRGGRIVVFDVAGDIALGGPLYVRGANITIDGTTAPPPGITLRNHGLIIRGNRGAHDVIVRGIRVRGSAIDGIQVAHGAYNVVIDRVSVSGSEDGNLDITDGVRDVTVSWSIFGANGKNMLVKYNTSRVTLHHNAFLSMTRNPQVRVDDSETALATETTADIRNNVIANWGSGYGTLTWYGPWANIIGNFYTTSDDALTVTSARAYVTGNLSLDGAELNGVGTESGPFAAPAVDTTDACTAANDVLASAGARPLDATDQALLSSIAPPSCTSLLGARGSSQPGVLFQAIEGGADPPQETVTIADVGKGGAIWTATARTTGGGPWLAVSTPAGEAPGTVNLRARNVAKEKAGTYSGTVDIRSSGDLDAGVSIPVVLVVAPAPPDAGTARFSIAAREDDGREGKSGAVQLRESSLALGEGGTVAFRFANVGIPHGAVIGSAVLRVVPIDRDSLAADIRLQFTGEASDDSPALGERRGSITDRARTEASVDFEPEAWALSRAQASPDLRAIVQEVVDRPGWRTGNALTLFAADDGSRGARSIGSRDDGADRAAVLTVIYWKP
jgi:hypothetical protein